MLHYTSTLYSTILHLQQHYNNTTVLDLRLSQFICLKWREVCSQFYHYSCHIHYSVESPNSSLIFNYLIIMFIYNNAIITLTSCPLIDYQSTTTKLLPQLLFYSNISHYLLFRYYEGGPKDAGKCDWIISSSLISNITQCLAVYSPQQSPCGLFPVVDQYPCILFGAFFISKGCKILPYSLSLFLLLSFCGGRLPFSLKFLQGKFISSKANSRNSVTQSYCIKCRWTYYYQYYYINNYYYITSILFYNLQHSMYY